MYHELSDSRACHSLSVVLVSILTAVLMGTCRYVLFENAMSIVKLNAVIAGAFDLKGVNEWVSLMLCCSTAVVQLALKLPGPSNRVAVACL